MSEEQSKGATRDEDPSALPSGDSPVWQAAVQKYYTELAKGGIKGPAIDKDLWKIKSPTDLLEEIRALQPQTTGLPRAWTGSLKRLEPILLSLNDFVMVTAWALGMNGRVSAVIWGSIRLILNLAQPVLPEILDMLEELRRTLPRYRKYEEKLPKSETLSSLLSDTYTEIIIFCAKTITYFRTNPNIGQSRNAWSEFNSEFLRTIASLREYSRRVDEEVDLIRLKREESAETLAVMSQLRDVKLDEDVVLPCHSIPYGLNPRFYGREEELAKIRRVLNPQERNECMRVMSIHGLGGVGKTQLALNFANTSLGAFKVILWVPSGTQIKMTQALSAFAKKIGLKLPKEDETEDNAQAARKVKDWLNQLKCNFLLVFDNVDAIDLLLQTWPSSNHGSILLTTRSSPVAWKRATEVIHLQSFPQPVGMNALVILTGISISDDRERKAVETIVDSLGGLPLAIVQISDFIRDRQYSYSQFLPLYQSSASRVIAKGENPLEYNHTLRTVWDLSLKNLSGDAQTLQQLLSFLEPDKIEEKMLTNPKSGLVDSCFEFLQDELDFGEAVGDLVRLSFVERSPSRRTLSMHRLVQEVVLSRLSAQQKGFFFDLTITLLANSISSTWRRTGSQQGHGWASWSQCGELLPHVARLMQVAKQQKLKASVPIHFAELIFKCGTYLWEREQPTMARSFFDYGLSLDVDREDETCNSAVRLLGHIALDVAQPKAALRAYNETLSARLKLVPSDDPAIADVYDSIACALTEIGDTGQAFKTLDKAVEIHKAKNPDRMARTDAILAMTYLRARSPDRALEAIKDCWRLQDMTEDQLEKSRYPKHSGDIVLLSRIRYAQGDRESALELASKSITIRNGIFGAKGPRVADSMFLVAKMLADEGKTASAMRLLRDIVEMSQGMVEMRGHRARAMWTLARLESEYGDADEVEKLRQEARDIRNGIELRETEDVDTDEDFAKLVGYMLW